VKRKRTVFGVTSWVERNLVNRAVLLGTRLGRDIDGVRELAVRGRHTGKIRRTPVKVLEVDGERFLVSLRGDSGWVHNLRAGQTARLRFGRTVEDVDVVELADGEKRRVAQAYLAAARGGEARQQLAWAAAGASEEDVRRGAMRTPVFRLHAPKP
jgi:deazaflavin-dependent oxidoreductase (nitroreductase family)